METPADEVHVIAPENLPPDLTQDNAPPIYPKNWPREIKLKVVAQVVKDGGSLPEVAAKYPPLSVPQLRGWIQAYKMEVTTPMEIPTKSNAKASGRRIFTKNEKVLYAVRYKKFEIDNWEEGARRLGVSTSALTKWVKEFDALKPQVRGAMVRIANGNNVPPPPQKIPEHAHKVAALLDSGHDIRELAKKNGVHRDTIKSWWLKSNPGKPWSESGSATRLARNELDPRAADAIKRVENGDLFADVAKDLGIAAPSTLRQWWRKLKGNDNWPKQYGVKFSRTFKAKKVAPRNPYGPNKMTRNKMSVREAILSNSKIMTAQETQVTSATEYMNGHPQPISTGKAMHDAIVFLKMARDLATKQVKTGVMQVDDPLILFPMLALNALSK
jgi:transposase-like protein